MAYMYARIVTRKKNGTTYKWVHIVESYRTKDGKVRQKTLANLGNIKNYKPGDIEKVINGLKRIFEIEDPAPGVLEDPVQSRDFGGSYTVLNIWEQIGWSEVIDKQLQHHRFGFDIKANVQVLVSNRLLDPCSKLHVLDWFEGVHLPGIQREEITYNHLLRTMDFLESNKEELELGFARALIDLFALDVEIIFYDVTSTYFQIDRPDSEEVEEESSEVSTLRRKGYSRDKRGDRPQVTIGLVMTREGIPLAHHVFPGNKVDKATLEEVVRDLKERFQIRSCTVIGDRGMLKDDNIQMLKGGGYDYIIAHPVRRNRAARIVIKQVEAELKELVSEEKERSEKKGKSPKEIVVDTEHGDSRFVVAHHEEIAQRSKKERVKKLRDAERFIEKLVDKLNRQDDGERFRGKKLTDEGALLKIHDYLRDRKLLRYYDVHLDEKKMLTWSADKKARSWENKIDGRMILETSNKSFSPREVVKRYKELQDIERCFRTMKSSLDLRPVFHRVDRRIRAHVFLCVMALQIDRLIRMRLRRANIGTLPTRALETLSRHRTIQANIDGRPYEGLTTATGSQLDLFKALEVPAPSLKRLEN